MKIGLSSKDDPRPLHVVLECSEKEYYEADAVIKFEVLEQKAQRVMERIDDKIVYRFNLERYLDKLMLAFPFAELSRGVHRRIMRAEEKRLEGFEVPELEIPGFTGKLYDFQKIAVAMLTDPDYAKAHGHSGVVDFLNDSMGLGKTFSSLASVAVLQAYPALVIVPNNAKYTWLEAINENYPKLSVGVYDAQVQRPHERDALIRERRDITIVNIEAIRARPIHSHGNRGPIIGWDYANPALFDYTYEFAILDEAHLVKTPRAQVTRGFFQLDAAEWWCAMTGTPILNRVEEVWSVLHKLYPAQFDSYEKFVQWIGVMGRDGRVKGYRPGPMKELRDFLNDRSLRRRKEQVIKDLPQTVIKPVLVDLSTEERRIYSKIEDELLLEMEDGTVRDIGGALPQITRMKQACFSPELFGGSQKSTKIEELKAIVKELVDSGEKALIFSQWEKATQIIARELSDYNFAYVTGKVKNQKRMEEIRKFNNDEDCSLYIGTIGANREAINLGEATYVIFTDEGWTPAGQDQAVGRSAAGGLRGINAGKETVVTVIILRADDSYEQNIEQMLDRKRSLSDRMTERDGGAMRDIKKMTLSDLKASLSSGAQKRIGKTKKKNPKA